MASNNRNYESVIPGAGTKDAEINRTSSQDRFTPTQTNAGSDFKTASDVKPKSEYTADEIKQLLDRTVGWGTKFLIRLEHEIKGPNVFDENEGIGLPC